MATKLFGTDGIRGRANEYPITPEIALRIGQAISRVLRSSGANHNRVIIGKDTRISGYMLETALTSGLVSSGMDVFLVGPMPTPAVAHLTKSMGCGAGIMLTASHNPYEDNGLKIFGPDGFKLSDDLEALVEQEVLYDVKANGVTGDKIGKAYRIDDARGRYIEFVKHSLGNASLDGMKIVVDCGHGAGYLLAPLIFKELGAKVVKLGVEPDGININAGVGALHPEFAGKAVKEQGADVGISLDGDADRVIFSDASGASVSGDRILALSALALKEEGKLSGNTMVCTVMSNLGLHEAMRKAGIGVVTTAVSDRHVIEALRKGGYSFGGENSGHLIFADYASTGDGILSALQVLRFMRKKGATLADLAAGMREYPQALVNLKVRSRVPLSQLHSLQEEIGKADAAFGNAGRHLIRYSGTENKLRILVEHQDQREVDRWSLAFKAAVEADFASF
ncbi:MAG: phosphoglucosamine mutase [Verrucomicrobiota bacterium]|jgi:phosphoglucosamine mutase